MADNIWDNSDADNDGNVAANWSLNRVPTGTDVAVYDSATTDANCTFSGAMSCQGMRFDNVYAGTVDAATFNITLGASGLDCTGGGSATLTLGTGTWEVSGIWDTRDIGTHTADSATVKLTGTANIEPKSANTIGTLDITGTISKTSAAQLNVIVLTISGTLTLDGGSVQITTSVTHSGSGTFSVSSPRNLTLLANSTYTLNSGTLSGAGTLTLFGGGNTFSAHTGTWSIATTIIRRQITVGAGTYGGNWTCIQDHGSVNRTFTFGGNVIFTGDVSWDSNKTGRTYTVDAATNDVSVEFRGDVSITETLGTAVWSKAATGTVTFAAGSGTQVYTDSTAAIQDLGLVFHDDGGGTGTLQLATEMECTTFDGDDGSFDPNTQTVDASGNVDWDLGWDFIGDADALNGSKWEVGGNFTAEAQTCKATAVWDLEVDGTAVASGAGDVQYSDASGFTEIDASATPWTDSGNNTNWNFGVVAAAIMNQFQGSNLGADLFDGALLV